MGQSRRSLLDQQQDPVTIVRLSNRTIFPKSTPKTILKAPSSPKNAPEVCSSIRPLVPPTLHLSDPKDSSSSQSTSSIPSSQLQPRQQNAVDSSSDRPAISNSKETEPPPMLPGESSAITLKLKSRPQKFRKDPQKVPPGSTDVPKSRSNDPKASQSAPPLLSLKPALCRSELADGVMALFPKLPLSPPRIPKCSTNSTIAKAKENSSSPPIKRVSQPSDSEYAEPTEVFGPKLASHVLTGKQNSPSNGDYEELNPLV